MLDWHKDYYNANPPAKKKLATLLTPDGTLTSSEKKRILLNNIYGVDIDVNAVEVTKLSLLLKCMEGETQASIQHQLSMFNERVLPSLENNIKCGNSLIDTDYYDNQLDFGEEKKIKPFNWQKAFPDVFKSSLEGGKEAVGGFDVVIGNPPYVRQELLSDQKDYYKKKYKVYHGMADLYSYFIENSINLLNEKGVYGVIVANKWMRANYGEPLRRFLKQQNIIEIIDFGDLPVFENATTYTSILIVDKGKVTNEVRVVKPLTLEFSSLNEYVKDSFVSVKVNSLEDNGWNLESETEQKLLQKIRAAGIMLSEFVQEKIYRGVLTGLNEAFVINSEIKDNLINSDLRSAEVIKRFAVGKDIKKYHPLMENKYLIFFPKGITNYKGNKPKNGWLWLKSNYLAIANYLESFKAKAEKRWDKGDYWWELRACDYYDEFEKSKILWPGISSTLTSFTLDEKKFYGNDNNHLIISRDKYLLGILNSSVTKFQLSNICDKVQGGFYRLKISYVKTLIIKNPSTDDDLSKKNEIIKLVDQLLKLNEEKQQAKLQTEIDRLQTRIDYCEDRINKIVYQLYGLTEEEIKIVEEE